MAENPSQFFDHALFSSPAVWVAAFDALESAVVFCRGDVIVWANAAALAQLGFASLDAARGAQLAELLDDAGQGLPGQAPSEAWLDCRLRTQRAVPQTLRWRRLQIANPQIVLLDPSTPGSNGLLPPACDLQLWQVELQAEPQTLSATNRALQDELQLAQREVQRLRQRLRQDAERREELLTVVSHELRTPVTVINGYNRLLLEGKVGPLNAEQVRFVSEITKSCQRISRFIGNLLEASRDASGEIVLDRREVSIADLSRSVLSFLQPLLDEQGLTATCRIEDAQAQAYCDAVRIEQVLMNLVGNAIQYTQRGGAIEIAASRFENAAAPWLEVAVVDNGPGVHPEDRERIFEPYTRVGESRHAGGLGLGLAICKRIVEAHGGTIRVEASETAGSRFCFTLPCTRGLAAANAAGGLVNSKM